MKGFINLKRMVEHLNTVYNSDAGGAFAFNPVLKYIIDDLNEEIENGVVNMELDDCRDLRREFWAFGIYNSIGHFNWERLRLDEVDDRTFVETISKFFIDGCFFAQSYDQMRKELDETPYKLAPNSTNRQIEKQYIAMVADVLAMIEEWANYYGKYYKRDVEELENLDY